MSTVYDIPTSNTLEEIAQVLIPRLTQDSPIFDIFPFEYDNEGWLLRWQQEDNYVGLQKVRGLGNKPGRVGLVGENEFVQKPGVYGEYIPLDEEILTLRRKMGTMGQPIKIADLVAKAQRQLLTRRIGRVEKILWDLAINGVFSVSDDQGNILHTDSYTPQTFSASAAWSDHVNSTPLADIRAMQLVPFGKSVLVGPASTLWINRIQLNHMMANQNQNDLGGKKAPGLASVNYALRDVNKYLEENDLPQVGVYDGFYPDDSGTPQRFISTGKGLLAGKRVDGAKIGGYRFSICKVNPNGEAKPYMKVIDKGAQEVPGDVEVHDGHNGGPVLRYPSGLVSCNI